MSDITDLESRISAALDRIGRGIEDLGAAPAAEPGIDPAEHEALKAQLDEEKTANAQLEERVKAIRDKLDTQMAQLEDDLLAQTARGDSAEEQLARLQKVNDELRANNNKAWFAAHRKDYEQGYVAPAKQFVVAAGERLRHFAPDVQAQPRISGSIFWHRSPRSTPMKSTGACR